MKFNRLLSLFVELWKHFVSCATCMGTKFTCGVRKVTFMKKILEEFGIFYRKIILEKLTSILLWETVLVPLGVCSVMNMQTMGNGKEKHISEGWRVFRFLVNNLIKWGPEWDSSNGFMKLLEHNCILYMDITDLLNLQENNYAFSMHRSIRVCKSPFVVKHSLCIIKSSVYYAGMH
jgi:hypothetical protein